MTERKTGIRSYLNGMIQQGLETQRLMVREGWHPLVQQSLTQIPDMAREILGPLVTTWNEAGETPPMDAEVLKLKAARDITVMTAERAEVVKDLLREMVVIEFARTAEILTINGVAAQKTGLEEQHPDLEHTMRKLSRAGVIDHYIPLGLGAFLKQMSGAMHTAARPNTHPDALSTGLNQALSQWNYKLSALAKTTTTGAFDRTKKAAGQALH